jgi:cytochrome c-type biogenesis protein CcmH
MTVWLIAAAMSIAATAVLLIPLLRRRNTVEDPAAYDVEVYKDQLVQVGQDYDRGLLSTEQAQAAKTEISRRLLNADSRRTAAMDPRKERGTAQYGLTAILALLVPAGALGLYAISGAPNVAGVPFAERPAGQTQTASGAAPLNLEAAATQLSSRLAEKPDDLNGWVLLARTYMSMQRYPAAAGAYEKALGLDAGNANLSSGYGEALFLAAGEIVTPASRAAFEETLKRQPDEPRSRFYIALAEEQAGDKQKALDLWLALVADSPADAPWLPSVRARITETATALGHDVAAIMPKPKPPQGTRPPVGAPNKGPTAAEIAEAEALSPEERIQRVRSMVGGLAARLKESPKDFQGWMQLIQSYNVLGEKDKALAALAKAREIFKAAPFPTQRLAALAGKLNLEGDGPRGPTQEQMAAAQNMSQGDQQAMIASMVERLAERLKENPNDVTGWTQLARSYAVLKQNGKAKDALSQALKFAPKNVDLMILYGRTVRSMNGDRQTTESIETMRKILAVSPTNVEALWFLGGAEASAGRKDEAKAIWERAIAQFPPGAPERAQLRARIDQLN